MLFCKDPVACRCCPLGQLKPDQRPSTDYASTTISVATVIAVVADFSRYLLVLDYLTCRAVRFVDIFVDVLHPTLKSMLGLGAGTLSVRSVPGEMPAVVGIVLFGAHLGPQDPESGCRGMDRVVVRTRNLRKDGVALVSGDVGMLWMWMWRVVLSL